MKREKFQALGQLISVEVFDEDMRETIWPMAGEKQDYFWLVKEQADKKTDEQIGKYFVDKYLFEYGNTFTYTVTRGKTEMRTFVRRVRETVNVVRP